MKPTVMCPVARPVICLFFLSIALTIPGHSQEAAFVHTSSASNIQNNWSYLDHPQLNGNPNAIFQMTSLVSGNRRHTGVWYESGQRKWAVYNQDLSPMPSGAAFNVAILNNGFIQQATAANTVNNYTYIDHPAGNANPGAMLFITPVYNPNGAGGVYNNHSTGVWYDSGRQKWAVFNQDRAAMPPGAAFFVDVIGAPQARTFTMGINGFGGLLPSEFAGANDVLLVTQNWNPGGLGGVYSDAIIQAAFEKNSGSWGIYSDKGNLVDRSAFNVTVIATVGSINASGVWSNQVNPNDVLNQLRTEVFLTDISPRHSNRFGPDGITKGRSSAAGRIISLAISSNGQRVYAGTLRGGLWRSDDGGVRWRQLTRPQPGGPTPQCPDGITPPCGLPMVAIADIAVAPFNPNLVFVATAMDPRMPERHGVYRSSDGGGTWAMVHQFVCTGLGGRSAPQPVGQIAFAPDDPTRLWAAGGCGVAYSSLDGTPDGPRPFLPPDAVQRVGNTGTWTTVSSPAGLVWHVGIGPRETNGRRRVYAAGDGVLIYSMNGGRNWTPVPGAYPNLAGNCGPPSIQVAGAAAASVIAVEPTAPERAYIALSGGSNGKQFFAQNLVPSGQDCIPTTPVSDGTNCNGGWCCGGAKLWSVTVNDSPLSFSWQVEASPPSVWGAGTNSGAVSLLSLPSDQGGFALFLADKNSVYVTTGRPTADGWSRLDGPSISAQCPSGSGSPDCNQNGARPRDAEGDIHMDPHVIAVTPGFRITLTDPPLSVPEVYRAMRERSGCASGQRLIFGTDGGTYATSDCGAAWVRAENLRTLHTAELAGLSRSRSSPSLYFGMPDNSTLYTTNGGSRWRVGPDCGDCAGFWTDPAVPDMVFHFSRGGPLVSWRSPTPGAAPDIWNEGNDYREYRLPPGMHPLESLHGSRPLIASLASEAPAPQGDMAVVATDPDGTYVWRLWEGNWRTEGPPLPAGIRGAVLQASGGHRAPIYYVADRGDNRPQFEPDRLWRLYRDGTGRPSGWDCIVPGPANPDVHDGACRTAPVTGGPGSETCAPGQVCRAFNFSAHPFDPNVVYISDWDGIKLSTDGGRSWRIQPSLTNLLSAGGTIPAPNRWVALWAENVQRFAGMTFVRNEPRTRFAVGVAGVFLSVDGATTNGETERWYRVLDTDALSCMAGPPYFEPEGILGRTLYVPCSGRSILRFSGIPGPSDASRLLTGGLQTIDLIELRPLEIETEVAKTYKELTIPASKLPEIEWKETPKVNAGAVPNYPPIKN